MKYLLLLTLSLAAIGITSCAHDEHRTVSTSTTETTRSVVPATTTMRTY